MIINPYAFGVAYDPDAQAFFTASGLTGTTNLNAINQLVIDLKGYGIWTKMKAIYPMIGGTAALHKWNLKDPQDLDAAFRLVFNGGWTHSSTGATPNGTNGYSNTYLDSANNLSLNNGHFSFYSRTNATTASIRIDMGSLKSAPDSYSDLVLSASNLTYFRFNNSATYDSTASATTLGFFTGSRTTSNIIRTFRNGTQIITGTAASNSTSAIDFYIGASNNNGTAQYFSNRECAFASLGDGLTNTEAANFYTAVQAYQTTLGRSIGPQTVSDPDAQAFVTAANIEDQVQAQAVNTLTIDLKAANIWTKMKAIYPFVGGTAASHKWNLKDPRDLDAAYRLSFSGGWTHSASGALPNGTNGYTNTYLATTGNLAQNSASMGVYSRNNTAVTGAHGLRNSTSSPTALFEIFERWTDNNFYCYLNDGGGFSGTNTDSRGFNQGSRTGATAIRYNRNTTTNTGTSSSNGTSVLNIYIGASNFNNSALYYNNREIAFFYVGDGLTNTEMQNYYTAVQAYQTTLNRQV